MSYSAQAAIKKILQVRCLNNRSLFLTVLEAEKPKAEALASSLSEKAALLLPRTGLPSLSSHKAETAFTLVSSYGTLLLLDQVRAPVTSLSLNYFHKGPVFNYTHVGR